MGRRLGAGMALAATLVVAGACGAGDGAHDTTGRPPARAGRSTTTAPTRSGPCGTRQRPPERYRHVVWIWMENHRADQVFGAPEAPYETALVAACGTAAHYEIVGNPSLPNYIGATSGDIQGIHDDEPPASHPLQADNLFRAVRRAGGTERTYAESMPAPCTLVSTGRYAVKHNPAPYYVGGGDRAACLADNVPLGTVDAGALRHDLDTDALPTFSLVIPDLCDDTHDCPVATGDAWLHEWVPRIVSSPAYESGRTALFVVWDEPTPMPFVAVSPTTVPGTSATQPVDHFSLLRTTQEMLGLTPLLGHAATAPSLRRALNL